MNTSQLGTALLKVVAPLFMIAVVVIILRLRKRSLEDNLALRKPPVRATALWLLLYAGYILGSDYFMNWRGPWDFTVWKNDPLLIDVMRVLAVAVLGPIAEELIFRGFLFSRLAQTKLGAAGAIALTAIVWGMIHYKYTPAEITLLIFAGVLLGLARYQTRSIITPMLMHMMWNIYAVW
jgi:membrane protease YdiL (CAAX protease family)